ncbi:MAG: DUF3137 domain-containing protein [Nocardioidaceae bacterium]
MAFGGIVILMFGGFLALVILIGVLGYLSAKKRREAFGALAAQRGWSYVERDDRWVDGFVGAPFGLGHSRRSENVLSGQYDGRPFVAFDYTYYTTEHSTDSEGRSTSREVSHSFFVAAIDVGASFPALEVNPEGFFSRVIGRLTNRDIELESEDFNRAFTVTCPDRKFASDVLHPRMMEFLLQHRDSAFRFDRRYILTVRAGQASIPEVDASLVLIDAILDQVPEFVWRQAEGR